MKIKCLSSLFLVVFSTVLFSSCNRKPKGTIAKVGGDYIDLNYYSEKQNGIPPQYKIYLETKQGKKQFLDILIKEKLSLKDAQKLGITKDKKYKKQISEIRQNLESDFKQYKQHLTTKLWLEKLKENGVLTVTESQIKDYHKNFPYEITIRHIMIDDPEKAEEILKQAKRKADFGSLARQYSRDPETKDKGGLALPFIMGELFMSELEDAAYGMKTGEIQGVFKTKFGYHIIKKYGEKKLAFKDAKDRVSKILMKRKLDEYIENLRKKYKVEVSDEDFV